MKRKIILLLLVLIHVFAVPVFVFAGSMFSPTWGFRLFLPAGYVFIDGDGRDRFSFAGPGNAMFDLVVYDGTYPNMRALVEDVNRRIGNRGSVDFFQYGDKQAAIIELVFGNSSGWGISVELDASHSAGGDRRPMLLALAHGPAGNTALNQFHLSALDSIVPSPAEQLLPGIITEYTFPRHNQKIAPLFTSGITSLFYENDAEAAQFLIEREFSILTHYINSQYLQDAWERYYRMVHRDSRARIANAAAAIAEKWNYQIFNEGSVEPERAFAQKALSFVQSFRYERDLSGSDFLNLVSVITEGRGNCDSLSMLWAILLASSDIRAAIMISPYFSHAMGLADIPGPGARFESHGTRWLVAETTERVDIGLIAQDVSDSTRWFGVVFD